MGCLMLSAHISHRFDVNLKRKSNSGVGMLNMEPERKKEKETPDEVQEKKEEVNENMQTVIVTE